MPWPPAAGTGVRHDPLPPPAMGTERPAAAPAAGSATAQRQPDRADRQQRLRQEQPAQGDRRAATTATQTPRTGRAAPRRRGLSGAAAGPRPAIPDQPAEPGQRRLLAQPAEPRSTPGAPATGT